MPGAATTLGTGGAAGALVGCRGTALPYVMCALSTIRSASNRDFEKGCMTLPLQKGALLLGDLEKYLGVPPDAKGRVLPRWSTLWSLGGFPGGEVIPDPFGG